MDAEETVIVEALGFLNELCTSKQIRKPALLAAAKKVSSSAAVLRGLGWQSTQQQRGCEGSHPVELLLLQHLRRVSIGITVI